MESQTKRLFRNRRVGAVRRKADQGFEADSQILQSALSAVSAAVQLKIVKSKQTKSFEPVI